VLGPHSKGHDDSGWCSLHDYTCSFNQKKESSVVAFNMITLHYLAALGVK
jgi:hypothetical protein